MCHKLLFDDDAKTKKQKNEISIQREGYNMMCLDYPPLVLVLLLIYLYSISEKKYRCIIYMYVRMDFLV